MLATKHITLTDTSLQTLFEIPSGYLCVITYIFVANHGGATNQATLYWDNGGTPQVYIFDGVGVNGGDRLTLGGQSATGLFVLHEGEAVKCQAGSAGDLEVVVTFKIEPNDNRLSNFN